MLMGRLLTVAKLERKQTVKQNLGRFLRKQAIGNVNGDMRKQAAGGAIGNVNGHAIRNVNRETIP